MNLGIIKGEKMNESDWQFITFEQENRRRQHLLIDYHDFEKADQPNRAPILANPRAIMEEWFADGVRYGRDADMILPPAIKPYVNMPERLKDALELAAGTIKRNILKKKVCILDWPDVIFRTPAIPLDILRAAHYTMSRELKAGCGPDVWIRTPPYGTVYETEHLPPRERAKEVSHKWYDLELYWQYIDIARRYTQEGWRWGPNPEHNRDFARAYERRDEIVWKLSQSPLSEDDQFIYACCRRCKGFDYQEVKEGLRQIGSHKSIDQLKKWFAKNEKTLVELGLLKKQPLACQDPAKYDS